MPLVLADRVVERSDTKGLANFTLQGTSTGYQAFSAVGNGSTVYYTIEGVYDDGTLTGEWEVGVGVYNAGILSRDTILSSSTGSKVSFTTGQKNVFIDLPSEKAVVLDDTDKVSGYAITGGSINNTPIGATTASTGRFTSVTTPSVTATTNDLTLSAISTGAVKFNTLGGTQAQVIDQSSADLVWSIKGGSSSLAARATFGTNSGAPNFYATGNTIIFTTNGANNADALRISHTASAVNYVQVTGSATGSFPVISAQGSDSTLGLNMYSKGGARINFFNNNGANRHVSIGGNGSAAINYIDLNGSPTNVEPTISVAGSDTNISLGLQSKGTGAIDLAAGSLGVNISNGGTVTAITRTAGGTSYTSPPTVAISAPTTAGGVQATMSAGVGAITQAISSGGTGYTVGDILTVSGGTFINSAPQAIRVDAVSGGVITGISISVFGQYTALPTNPVSVTGGTGTGATFNLSNWSYTGHTITNAGSGYIEQPTVTFSGGGGSGAAAYATVGGTTTVKSLGSTMNFYTANTGIGLQIRDSGGGQGASGGYWTFAQNYSSNGVMYASSTGNISSGGATNLNFQTNTTAQTQMVVSHTASAVNYVQVTGGSTGSQPIISAQGSDTNIAMSMTTKGNGNLTFRNQNNSNVQLRIYGTNAAVNNLAITGTTATNAPVLSAEGSDTNIDLALTPKGTGLVRFGTYVAGALTATGYINIKAADGTTYKVLVST